MPASMQVLWHKPFSPSQVFVHVALYNTKVDVRLATDEVYDAFSQDSDTSF